MSMITPINLRGSVVVVTGASRGLGAAFAGVLATAGAAVAICARDKSGLDSVCKMISGKGGTCYAAVADVTNSADVNSFVAAVAKKFGRVDVLINNAGAVHPKKNAEEITDEEYSSCMRTNVDGVFYFARAVLPIMRKQGSGAIVNISSGAGTRAHGGLSIYSMSKFAVEGLTQAVARELEGTPIMCIALCPGGINTGMRAALFGKEDAEKQQSPQAVAEILRDILSGKVAVPNGADVRIRGGAVTGIDDVLHTAL